MDLIKAPLFMILVELIYTGFALLSKLVLNQGMFVFALLTYCQIVATVILLPVAFFLERGIQKKLTWKAMGWITLNGLFGITIGLGFYYYGLQDTSATYTSTFVNLIPVVTFLLSTVLRIENLGLKTTRGRIRIVGTILCVGGAILTSLYRGKALNPHPSHNAHKLHDDNNSIKINATKNMKRGSLYLASCVLSFALWYISQMKAYSVFPSIYWTTMLSCLVGGIVSAIVGIALERRKSAWRLGWDFNLLTIAYSGALGTGMNFCLTQWVVARRGPTYPAMFEPLIMIFVAILESLFMGEELFVGSILGMILIIGGLFAFLWGQGINPLQANKKSLHVDSSTTQVPNQGDITAQVPDQPTPEAQAL